MMDPRRVVGWIGAGTLALGLWRLRSGSGPFGEAIKIRREATALSRTQLSVPVREALRRRLIHKGNTVFDYGTGRGFDPDELSRKGIRAAGWDPFWRAKIRKAKADVVNLGYILNVIEDPRERKAVLADAWKLADKVLVVAVRPKGEEAKKMKGHRRWGDGWLVGRGSSYTFQKFYTQAELEKSVREVVGARPEVELVGPGIAFVWKDPKAHLRVVKGGLAGLGRALPAVQVRREETAMRRKAFSAPTKLAIEERLIHKGNQILDYGTGHGFDPDELRRQGIPAVGWDPYWRPQVRRSPADVVTVNYVLNVIEDPTERVEVLRDAWGLTRKVMVVGVQKDLAYLKGAKVTPYQDGVITSKGTFQTLIRRPDLLDMIKRATGRDGEWAGPGIAFVWKDEKARKRVASGGLAGLRAALEGLR